MLTVSWSPDDRQLLTCARDPGEAADRLLELGVEIAIVKQGPEGVLVATREGRTSVPPVPTEVVNGLGAGDAFGGSLAYGLLHGWTPERAVRMANAAGSIVASRLACADAMPTLQELEGDGVPEAAPPGSSDPDAARSAAGGSPKGFSA